MGQSISSSCKGLPPCGPDVSACEEEVLVLGSPKTDLPRLLGKSHQEDALLFGPAAQKDEQKTPSTAKEPEGFFLGLQGEDSAKTKQGEDSAETKQEPEDLSSGQEDEVPLVPEAVENSELPGLIPLSPDPNKEARKAERKRQKLQARNQVLPFLMKNGFRTVKSQKNSCWRVSYPLHAGVKHNDAENVRLLLKAHADPKALDSLGRTPLELASQLNHRGSHSEVLGLLRSTKGFKSKSSEVA